MFEIRQRFVELIVTITLGDQALELDTAELGHLKDFFDVVGLPARYAGNRDLAGDEVAAADRERSAAEAADDRRRAARASGLNDLVGGFRIADRLESFVDAAIGELDRRFHRVFRARIDSMRRAKISCRLQLIVGDVHRDDRIGAETFEELNRVQPMPPQPMTNAESPGSNLPRCFTAL